MSQLPTTSDQRRVLGLGATTAIVVASMIGSGIFVTTGEIGPSLVSPGVVLLVWVVCGVLALCGALSLGELGAMLPRAGGAYVFIRRACGPQLGCFVGLESMLVSFPASLAIIALVMGRYLERFDPSISGRATAIIVVVIITLVHCRGTVFGAAINTAGAVLKVFLLLIFIVLGLILPTPASPDIVAATSGAPSVLSSAFSSAVLIVIFAYQGWAIVTVVGGEITRPGRNIPLGILIAVVLVTAIYVLVNIVFLRAVAPVDMVDANGTPTATIGSLVASQLFPAWMVSGLDGLIVLFLVSTLLSVALAGGRMAYAISAGGQLHRGLSRLNSRGAPVPALLLQGAITIVLVGFFDIKQLLIFSGLLGLFTTSLMIGTVFILRWREPDLPRPFRVPLYPVPPLAFILLSIWLIWSAAIDNPIEIQLSGIVIAVLGVLAAICIRLNRGDESGAPGRTMDQP
ncbi:MAG: amino acid permease [Phycisphaerales bacterium]|nr:amino acid permease [Phycisphaerales bacterium]